MSALVRRALTAAAKRRASGGGDTSTVLLMHMDGVQDGTVFTDEMGHTVTRVGAVTKTSATLAPQFGTACGYFDGTNDYLQLDGSPDFAFGTGDFTIEFWLHMGGVHSTDRIFYDGRDGAGGTQPTLYTQTGGALTYFSDGNRITGGIPPLNTWTHIALSRVSNVTRLFMAGVKQGSDFADTINYTNPANRPIIGSNGTIVGNVNSLIGYMDEIRVKKGIGLYTTNFTPPTAPFTD